MDTAPRTVTSLSANSSRAAWERNRRRPALVDHDHADPFKLELLDEVLGLPAGGAVADGDDLRGVSPSDLRTFRAASAARPRRCAGRSRHRRGACPGGRGRPSCSRSESPDRGPGRSCGRAATHEDLAQVARKDRMASRSARLLVSSRPSVSMAGKAGAGSRRPPPL